MEIYKSNKKTSHAALMFGVLCITSIIQTRFALAQTAKYDGVYAGSQTLTDRNSDNNYSRCLKGPFKRKLVVKDGTATYVYNPTYQGTATGRVSDGGDVAATDPVTGGGVSLAGEIQGDEFVGEVWSLYCTYLLQLKRVP